MITGGGGGDGGLFNGILVRYLAMVATTLPVVDPEDERARRVAARIVLASAQAAWANRLQIEGLPLFGRDWSVQARLPGTAPGSRASPAARCAARGWPSGICRCS